MNDLAEILHEQGVLTDRQRDQVRKREERHGIPQHRAAVDLGYSSESIVWKALADHLHLPFLDAEGAPPSQEILESVPLKLVFHYRMIPWKDSGASLLLAFSDPPSQLELGKLRLLLGRRIEVALTTPSALHELIQRQFGLGAENIERIREERDLGEDPEDQVFTVADMSGMGSDMESTIADFADKILGEAVRMRATDIHLEPYPKSVKLRYRIDGVMQSVPVPGHLRLLYDSLSSRIKIMAGLDIAEKRLPQDGRIAMKRGEEEFDLRLSTIPTKHGEAICLRVLGRDSLQLDPGQLGMTAAQESLFTQLTALPQGLILVTGPTGSGKTTTLYAGLACANDEHRKIITIEDPVEYQVPGATQIQVRPEVGLTFAAGLRAILRHDPDVVLVGEIRDLETAEIGVRAAQTGHLVFSTLHTNDSIGAIPRLMDMGVDPFLVGSTLVCSMAQRLARRICRHCIQPDPDIPQRLREEFQRAFEVSAEQVVAFRGAGCLECARQGNRGRLALYEFLLMTEELADAVQPGVKSGDLKTLARRVGWRSLRENGMIKLHDSQISVDELERVTRRPDFEEFLNPGLHSPGRSSL